ncbi:ABC transporter permease [Mesorhizobium sp. M3A.F.Ca.ET.080.04.2.1]|uniref:ABC transporter permease n=1 Tax=Mesorhizobium sp. M3A.F.Ca.ET.080.04.2.1 TaxID=2493676 RepID=UPI000F75138E|nr:ABC transporter permease [Mesorhizobium sp. M3A.F.Ca.ET.080.04.2.1]AZO09456.1 ABC transporter permease [Mesorhizobium sp. M3A.F.Ca.ET.080.04.2.1]RWF25311.1 MAG: ABC transporter permease [Mesorhizobium sp.]
MTDISAASVDSQRWRSAAAMFAMLFVWQAVSAIVASRLFPGPAEVVAVLLNEAWRGDLAFHLGISLARVAVSLSIAMVVGAALGYAAGRSQGADLWLKPWIVLFLNVPALVTVILIYVWLGLIETALVLAVALNKIPNVAVTIREGASRLDKDLAEMAEIYRFGHATMLRHVVLPQLAPFFMVALRSGLALTWKIVLLAELLGRSNGVGFQLQVYFQNFDVPRIMAYAISFGMVMLALEYGLLAQMERRLTGWQR